MSTKRMIGREEIEAQVAFELPDRELMVTVLIIDLANGNSTPITVPTLSQALLVEEVVTSLNGITSVDMFTTAVF